MNEMRKLMEAVEVLTETPLEKHFVDDYYEALDIISNILYEHISNTDMPVDEHMDNHLESLVSDIKAELKDRFRTD